MGIAYRIQHDGALFRWVAPEQRWFGSWLSTEEAAVAAAENTLRAAPQKPRRVPGVQEVERPTAFYRIFDQGDYFQWEPMPVSVRKRADMRNEFVREFPTFSAAKQRATEVLQNLGYEPRYQEGPRPAQVTPDPPEHPTFGIFTDNRRFSTKAREVAEVVFCELNLEEVDRRGETSGLGGEALEQRRYATVQRMMEDPAYRMETEHARRLGETVAGYFRERP